MVGLVVVLMMPVFVLI